MTNGFTASAYVEMLEKMEAVALSEKNLLSVKHDKAAFEFAHATARLDTLREALSEARKLRNAIANSEDWSIQKDGSVRVLSNHKNVMVAPEQRGLLDG